ncbi:MAG: hypothetical protein AMXMBFR37_12740 [Steroidobacteraceae bacterium]
MKIELSPVEARVIGSLIEKQVTTPDLYPLSLNSLVSACNQKSNRDPVLALDEGEVQRTLDALSRRHLVIERSGFGSRVPKYQQCFCNTEYGSLRFTPVELAIVCELLLRGPQTPGELRTRVPRMAALTAPDDIETALQALATREGGAIIVRLPRQPGRRDACYAQLFTGPVEGAVDGDTTPARPVATPSVAPATHAASIDDRLGRLEAEVAALRAGLDELKRRDPAG